MYCLLLCLDKVVNDGIQEDTANADSAAQQLHEIERLAKDERHADNDDHALGRVGYRLGDGVLSFEVSACVRVKTMSRKKKKYFV